MQFQSLKQSRLKFSRFSNHEVDYLSAVNVNLEAISTRPFRLRPNSKRCLLKDVFSTIFNFYTFLKRLLSRKFVLFSCYPERLFLELKLNSFLYNFNKTQLSAGHFLVLIWRLHTPTANTTGYQMMYKKLSRNVLGNYVSFR